MFGSVLDAEPLAWSWAEEQLRNAETYWVVSPSTGHPHPRPVWGVWHDDAVQLSLGSPVLRKHLTADTPTTVHLDSGIDVVIMEGRVGQLSADDAAGGLLAYNSKYDWNYGVEQYGPLTKIDPVAVIAWRAEGPAGRNGFRQGGRWRFG